MLRLAPLLPPRPPPALLLPPHRRRRAPHPARQRPGSRPLLRPRPRQSGHHRSDPRPRRPRPLYLARHDLQDPRRPRQNRLLRRNSPLPFTACLPCLIYIRPAHPDRRRRATGFLHLPAAELGAGFWALLVIVASQVPAGHRLQLARRSPHPRERTAESTRAALPAAQRSPEDGRGRQRGQSRARREAVRLHPRNVRAGPGENHRDWRDALLRVRVNQEGVLPNGGLSPEVNLDSSGIPANLGPIDQSLPSEAK